MKKCVPKKERFDEFEGLRFGYMNDEVIKEQMKVAYEATETLKTAMMHLVNVERAMHDATFETYSVRVNMRSLAARMLSFGRHDVECEWNNVTVGSMKDESKNCTCGWAEFKGELKKTIRKRIDERRW